MSTHNICFCGEISKIPILFGGKKKQQKKNKKKKQQKKTTKKKQQTNNILSGAMGVQNKIIYVGLEH